MAASAVGLLLSLVMIAFTSSGVNADAARRGIVRWSGPGFALRKSFHAISEDHRLELVTKTITHPGGPNRMEATITTHTVSFVGDNDHVAVAQSNDRSEARRRAELVAKAFGVDLHVEYEGERRTVALADLDEPLRSRLLRGKAPKCPKPTRTSPDYKCEGDTGTIELPAAPVAWQLLLLYAAAVGGMVFFGLNRSIESDIPFYIGLTGFAVLLTAALVRVFHFRTRVRRASAHIVASPEGLQLSLRGLLRTRELSFTIEELEDLDVVQVGNSKSYALLARSDDQEVIFGSGKRSALKWTRKAIAYHLTR